MALKVNVKLFGTLSRSFEEYDHSSGLDLVLLKGASIDDLLVQLDLLNASVGMIFMDDQQVKRDTCVKDNARIKIFQPIFGG